MMVHAALVAAAECFCEDGLAGTACFPGSPDRALQPPAAWVLEIPAEGSSGCRRLRRLSAAALLEDPEAIILLLVERKAGLESLSFSGLPLREGPAVFSLLPPLPPPPPAHPRRAQDWELRSPRFSLKGRVEPRLSPRSAPTATLLVGHSSMGARRDGRLRVPERDSQSFKLL